MFLKEISVSIEEGFGLLAWVGWMKSVALTGEAIVRDFAVVDPLRYYIQSVKKEHMMECCMWKWMELE